MRRSTVTTLFALLSMGGFSLTAAQPPPGYDLHTLPIAEEPFATLFVVDGVGLTADGTIVGNARSVTRNPADPAYCKRIGFRYQPGTGTEVVDPGTFTSSIEAVHPDGTVYGVQEPGIVDGACLSGLRERPRPIFRQRPGGAIELLQKGDNEWPEWIFRFKGVSESGALFGNSKVFEPESFHAPFLYTDAEGWRDLREQDERFAGGAHAQLLTEDGEKVVVVPEPGAIQRSFVVHPDGTIDALGALNPDLGVTVVTGIDRTGEAFGVSRVAFDVSKTDHAFRWTSAGGIVDAHPGAPWRESILFAENPRGVAVGVATRRKGGDDFNDLYLESPGWGVRTVLQGETVREAVPPHLEFKGWSWTETNASLETVGTIRGRDPDLPIGFQFQSFPFYHHPGTGMVLLQSFVDPAEISGGRVIEALAINEKGSILLELAVPQPPPDSDQQLLALLVPRSERPRPHGKVATDPIGDTFSGGTAAIDTTGLTVEDAGGDLVITLSFAGLPPGLPDGSAGGGLGGYIDIDADLDSSTGGIAWTDAEGRPRSSGLGIEMFVDLFTFDGASNLVDVVAEDGRLLAQVPATLDGSTLEVHVPRGTLLPRSDVGIAAVVGDRSQASDMVPDDGFVTTAEDLPQPPPSPPSSDWIQSAEVPGFRFQVRIGAGSPILGQQETDCQPDTVCVSGALSGRSEAFLRVLGPRPNGYLWPTIVRFTPSQVEVWVNQVATDETRYYLLEAIPPGEENLSGLQDRTGFQP